MIILNLLPLLLHSFNYVTAVFLLSVVFGFIYVLIGGKTKCL